jgi:hypothetical protein
LGQKFLKGGVLIDRRFQNTCVEGSLTSGESTPRESVEGNFETSEARRAEAIHSFLSVGGHMSVDHELRVKSFQEETSKEI